MSVQNRKINQNTLFLTQFSMLAAIEAVFCFTPLGSLPIGPIVATLAGIPVVVAAILLGTKAGAWMGFIAGLFSFIVWTFMPPSPLAAFLFSPFYSLGQYHGNFGSVIICFVPRILVGTVTGLIYKCMSKSKKLNDKNVLNYSVSAAIGSLVNTFGVLGGIWIFFENQYTAIAEGKAMLVIIGSTILFSGLPEAFLAALAATAVCRPIKRILAEPREA